MERFAAYSDLYRIKNIESINDNMETIVQSKTYSDANFKLNN